ncbi:hypothetical protein MASR2M47_04840 [Draconibacterium sp.]
MNYFYRLLLAIIPIFTLLLNVAAQNLTINEIMSSNALVVYDEDGDTPDWLEIINNSTTEIDLSDYFLSDNPGNFLKWQFPQ